MPELVANHTNYTPSRKLQGVHFAGERVWANSIAHIRNRGRYQVICGVYHPDDIKYLGEVIYIVRTEEQSRMHYSVSTIDAFLRGAPSMVASVERRTQQLENMQDFVTEFHRDIVEHWPERRNDLNWLATTNAAIAAWSASLSRAQTLHRREVRERLPRTRDVRTQDGRQNPSATAARLIGIHRQLVEQLTFDLVSANSLEDRIQVGLDAFTYDCNLVERLTNILLYGSGRIAIQQLNRHLPQLNAKPFVFVSAYTQWLLRVEPIDSVHTRTNIMMAFEAELGLAAFNLALSRIRDTPSSADSATFELLRESLSGFGFAHCYQALANELGDWLSLAEQAIHSSGSRSTKDFKQAIKQMKYLLRYRFDNSAGLPWSVQHQTNHFGDRMIAVLT